MREKNRILLCITVCLAVLSAGNAFATVMSSVSFGNIRVVSSTNDLTATISDNQESEWFLSAEHGVSYVEFEHYESDVASNWLDGDSFTLMDDAPNSVLAELDNTISDFGASGVVSGNTVSGDSLWDNEVINGDGTLAFSFTDLYQFWDINTSGAAGASSNITVSVDAVIDIEWDNVNLSTGGDAYINTEVYASLSPSAGIEAIMWAEYDADAGTLSMSSGAVVDTAVSDFDMTSGRLRITKTFDLDLGELFSGDSALLSLAISNSLAEKNNNPPISGAPVPEPGTMLLFGLGIGVLGITKGKTPEEAYTKVH